MHHPASISMVLSLKSGFGKLQELPPKFLRTMISIYRVPKQGWQGIGE